MRNKINETRKEAIGEQIPKDVRDLLIALYEVYSFQEYHELIKDILIDDLKFRTKYNYVYNRYKPKKPLVR